MKTKLFLTVLFAGIYFAGTAQWATQANVPIKAGQESAVSYKGSVYVFGGHTVTSAESDSLFIFNQAGNYWAVGALIPSPTRGAAAALGNDSLIYCFSGYYGSSNTDSCYSYNPRTNVWKGIKPIPTGVWYAAAATAPSGRIYVFGGEKNSGLYNLVQIYNPVNNTWSTGAPMPAEALGEAAVTAKNGKIYVIGGYNTGSGVIDSVQIYDPVGDTWSRGTPMPTARHQFAYGIDQNNIIYCVGGKTAYGNMGKPFYNVVERYDAYTDTWLADGPMLPHGLGEVAGACVNNGMNVLGGVDSTNGYFNWNYRLDIAPSSILSVNAKNNLTLYPNPSNGKITILMDGNGQNVNLRITDIAGQTCYTQTWSNVTGGATKQIDLGGLSKGIYFVQCISGNNTIVKKLLLQ